MITRNRLIGSSAAVLATAAAGSFSLISPPVAFADSDCAYNGVAIFDGVCFDSFCGPNHDVSQKCVDGTLKCGCS